MSRLLLDQNVDRRVASGLAALGHDAVHLAELGMQRSTDQQVMEHAVADQRTVITHDSDFAQLLARSGASAPSVIRVRAPMAGHQQLVALIDQAITAAAKDLEAGAVVSVSERGARIRPLPISQPRE